MSLATIRNIEQGATGTRDHTEAAIIAALNQAHLFIETSPSGGTVLRLEKREGGEQNYLESLEKHILNCQRKECVATLELKARGARLMLGKARHLELAVLAAAGEQGLSDLDLVKGRRDYAGHLQVPLSGEIANADWAIHADKAAEGPSAKHAINLGSAAVTKSKSSRGRAYDHYVLKYLHR